MPTSSGDAIQIAGLDEFRKALRAADQQLPKVIGQANKKAAEVVAVEARSRAQALGSTAGHVAASIRSSAAANAATILLGSNAYPMALGAEFGALLYKQFKPWRGNQWIESGDEGVGYFLHPAVRDKREEVGNIYLDLLEGELERRAFPD